MTTKSYVLLIATWLIAFWLTPILGAQEQTCRLRVEAKNLTSDSIWLGESFGRRAVSLQLMQKVAEGIFEIAIPQYISQPCQALVYEPSPGAKKAYATFLVATGECNLDAVFDPKSIKNDLVFKNSTENTLYASYRSHIEKLLKTRDDCNNTWRLLNDESSLLALQKAETSLLDYQESFLRENAQTFAVKFVGEWMFRIPPTPSAQMTMPQIAAYRQNWFRTHYLEGVNLASELFWKSPMAIDWLDQFTFKTAMPHPDSVKWHADEVYDRLESYPAAQAYYLNYMLNSFEKMTRFNYDEVYIHLVDAYVKSNKHNGYSDAGRAEKIATAQKIERIKVGKTLPEVTLYSEDGSAVAISEIDAPFTFLMFFQPDCSHCKKEIPVIKRLDEKYASDGLKVVLVCGRIGDLSECWKYRASMAIPEDWLMLADSKNQSKFRTLYNIDGYPRLFLLDNLKTILYRRGGSATEVELEQAFKLMLDSKN